MEWQTKKWDALTRVGLENQEHQNGNSEWQWDQGPWPSCSFNCMPEADPGWSTRTPATSTAPIDKSTKLSSALATPPKTANSVNASSSACGD